MDKFYIWMESFSKKQIEKVNATYHKYGFHSSISNEIVFKLIHNYLKKNPKSKVLDYGSGKDPLLAKELKKMGIDVHAHEVGANKTKHHDKKALNNKYDLVIAINVLNVQDDKSMLNKALEQIKDVLKKNGSLLATFPVFPNETGMSQKEFKDVFRLHFETVKFKTLKSGGIIAEAKV